MRGYFFFKLIKRVVDSFLGTVARLFFSVELKTAAIHFFGGLIKEVGFFFGTGGWDFCGVSIPLQFLFVTFHNSLN